MNVFKKACRILVAAGLVVVLPACDLFDVVNPGPIVDDALNEEAAGKTVLIGVVADVEVALDNMAWLGRTGFHGPRTPTRPSRGCRTRARAA